MLTAALWYQREMGFSVIPVEGKSGHLVKWSKYQNELASEDQIKDWWGSQFKTANIAIVTGKISGITVFDIDSYKLDTNQLAEIEKAFPTIATPTAISANGGEHRYFEYNPDIPTRNDVMHGLDIKNDGGVIIAPPSQNGAGKYLWKPESKISALALGAVPSSYIYNINALYIKGSQGSQSQVVTSVTSSHKYFIPGRRDEDLFTVANALTKSRLDSNFIKQTLELIVQNMGSEFNGNVINAKIKSAMQRVDKVERNISDEARQWVLAQPGHFQSQVGHNELHLVTSSHKHTFNVALTRMAAEDPPIIKKYGSQRGVYIRVENDLEEIDWRGANGSEIKFEWMMGFSEYIKTMPKTVYVIAGDPDSGKSAICLNLAIQNCGNMPVSYFSSEMGAEELASRMRHYDNLNEAEITKNVKFYERDNNFQDVIKPDHINIIDYFEISNEFWEIAETLKQIRHNLNQGIAIVAVQKKRGSTLGRGAEFGLEKPRLYMRVEPYKDKLGCYDGNIITIEKAKNWRDPMINPNHLTMRYKLVKGINFKKTYAVWQQEIDEKYNGFKK